jgi:hypothetical protein
MVQARIARTALSHASSPALVGAVGLAQAQARATSQEYLRLGPGFIAAGFSAFMGATNDAYYRGTAPEGGPTSNTTQTGSFSENNRASCLGLDNMVDKYYEPGRTITLGIRGTF